MGTNDNQTPPQPTSLIREPILIVCTTVIVLALIASVTILSTTGHGMDVERFVRLGYNGLVAIATLSGVLAKLRTVHTAVTNSESSDTSNQ